MTCAQRREAFLARRQKFGVKRRVPGVWVAYDVYGAPIVVRASWRDAYNTAYARAYERDQR